MTGQERNLTEFHERIAAWRASGLDWREIGDELAAIGVDVQWNAVWRYARDAGIPTARTKKPATSTSSVLAVETTVTTPPPVFSLGGFLSWAAPAQIPAIAKVEDEESAHEDSADSTAPDESRRAVYRAHEHLFVPLAASTWDAETPVLEFGDQDRWTMQDSFEGLLITGATGSGKTSSSGRMIAESFLTLGYGGIVLTAKEDERALWERYAKRTGRTDQLCVFRLGGPFKFNFMDYQTRLPEERGGSTENVVNLFHSVLETFSRTKRTTDTFWSNAARQLLRNVVRVIRATGEPFNLKAVRHFVSEMPRSLEEANAGAWKTSPTFGRLISAAKRNCGSNPAVDLEEALRYWLSDFPGLYSETRSTITSDFAALVDLMFEPAIWDLFGADTTITPEAVFEGAIIVVDLSVKKHAATGRLAQQFWKHLFQLAVERRSDADGATRRPVFLWSDECQLLVAENDLLFTSTARSSRCATVYLTQTLPGFQAAMGGDLARERVAGLFANLTSKCIHANGDPDTNQWAATQIGQSFQFRVRFTRNEPSPLTRFSFQDIFAHLTRQSQSSVSTEEVMDFEVHPSEFAKLRTGSAKHNCQVDAIWLKPGAVFSNGKHYFQATFPQE